MLKFPNQHSVFFLQIIFCQHFFDSFCDFTACHKNPPFRKNVNLGLTKQKKCDNVKLTFEEEALVAIADQAFERKTGARGLRSIIEGVLQEIMFTAPSDKNILKITITEDTVNGKKPIITKK